MGTSVIYVIQSQENISLSLTKMEALHGQINVQTRIVKHITSIYEHK